MLGCSDLDSWKRGCDGSEGSRDRSLEHRKSDMGKHDAIGYYRRNYSSLIIRFCLRTVWNNLSVAAAEYDV